MAQHMAPRARPATMLRYAARFVMAALVAAIHVFNTEPRKDVDGRNKSGHDGVSA